MDSGDIKEIFGDGALDPDDFDGPLLEECDLCNASGVVNAPLAQVAVCPDCEGTCYVEHDC